MKKVNPKISCHCGRSAAKTRNPLIIDARFLGRWRVKPAMTVFLTAICLILLTSCAKKQYTVKNMEVARVEMDSAWEPAAGTKMQTLVNSLKAEMTEETQKIIGTANQTLIKGRPQSLLSNFTADALSDYASGLWGTVDFAVMNIGGIRNTLNQGNISIGNMYEIYPFNNRLVLLELPGAAVAELFDSIAKIGGEGLSKTVELVIRDKAVESLKINGKSVDENGIYRIATIDYLAEGNDRMSSFAKAVKVTDSNKLLRDILIEHIKKLTAANKTVNANLDNRITVKK